MKAVKLLVLFPSPLVVFVLGWEHFPGYLCSDGERRCPAGRTCAAQPGLRKSWGKTRLQRLYDLRREVAELTGCNIPTDFIFCFLSLSLASEVVFPADVTFLLRFSLASALSFVDAKQ